MLMSAEAKTAARQEESIEYSVGRRVLVLMPRAKSRIVLSNKVDLPWIYIRDRDAAAFFIERVSSVI